MSRLGVIHFALSVEGAFPIVTALLLGLVAALDLASRGPAA